MDKRHVDTGAEVNLHVRVDKPGSGSARALRLRVAAVPVPHGVAAGKSVDRSPHANVLGRDLALPAAVRHGVTILDRVNNGAVVGVSVKAVGVHHGALKKIAVPTVDKVA